MNRLLQAFNLLGVLVLTILCVSQWWTNRSLNLEALRLERARLELVSKLETQETMIKGCADDLNSFREQLTHANVTWNEMETKLAVAEREIGQLGSERDQLKTSVTNWAKAVTARDDRLKAVNEQLQQFVTDRNTAVTKFNELAQAYNAVVKDLNLLRATQSGVPTNSTATKGQP